MFNQEPITITLGINTAGLDAAAHTALEARFDAAMRASGHSMAGGSYDTVNPDGPNNYVLEFDTAPGTSDTVVEPALEAALRAVQDTVDILPGRGYI